MTTAAIITNGTGGQVLNVRIRREDGDAGITPEMYGGRTAITIAKLPDNGDYIRLTDSAPDNYNPSSTTALQWDTELEVGSAFVHTNDYRIEVNTDDDYLFFATIYDDDDAVTRGQYWQRWRKNGSSVYQYGTSGRYGRNASDSNGNAEKVGNRSAIIADLDSGDYIEAVTEAIGAANAQNADYVGLQGVRLGSILSAFPIRNLAPTGITNNQATLNATLVTPSTNYTVYVYWGGTDGGTNAGSWSGSAVVGSWTNVATTNISYLRAGLQANSTNWYTFSASNSTGVSWAEPSWRFTTLPIVGQPGTLFQFR